MSEADAESPETWEYSEPEPIPVSREDVLEAAELIAGRLCNSLQWLQQPPDDGEQERALVRAINSISVGTDTSGIESRLDNIEAIIKKSLDQQTKAILQSAEIQAAATRENTKALLIFAKATIEGRQ